MRKEEWIFDQRMLNKVLPSRREKGRPQRRFVNALKEDIRRTGVTEEYPRDGMRWRQMMHHGEPKGGTQKMTFHHINT